MILRDFIEKTIDNRGKNPSKYYESEKYPVIDNVLIKNKIYPNLSEVNRYIDQETFDSFLRGYVHRGMPLMTLVGNGIGNVTLAPGDDVAIIQNTVGFQVKENLDEKYLYYYLLSNNERIRNFDRGSGQPSIRKTDILGMEVDFPDIDIQKNISKFLYLIDLKIERNENINKNLEEQVLAIYNQWFEVNSNCNRQTCRAEEYFNIAIGKTPPRKESEWFSANPDDVTWVSISDMGSCGTYIRRSSEQLTKEAIERHNIKIVPDNTVLLSFKLTIGRIAITVGEMTTNEAIAHFKTDNTEITEYLYCYLKNFNYQTMGSTSSIATAVNSKIIKAMPFVIPTDEELYEFHAIAGPIFSMIKENQLQTDNLSELRDSLLPKLMSGEIDVSDIDL